MINVKNPRCASCALMHVQRKGDFCAVCDEFFSNNGTSRRTRRKEIAVIDALKEAGLLEVDNVRVFEITYNKSIGTSCGSYRPDILIDCGTFVVVIEVDEFQHGPRVIGKIIDRVPETRVVANYEPSCELVRMMNIRLAKGVPCHFIRFNPDAFKIDGNTVRVSPNRRHAALCAQVEMAMHTTPRADLVVTYMYYDNALLRTEIPLLPAGHVWHV